MNDHRVKAPSRFLFRALTIVAAVAVSGSIGCQAVNPLPGFGVGKTTTEESRVRKLMEWHSGRVEVYKDFRTVFTARALFISDEIRESVVEWEARSRLLTPEEKQDLLEEIQMGRQDSVQILLGFYTPETDLNDLEQKDSTWVVFLEKPDGSVVKASCQRFEEEKAKIFMRHLEWDLSWSRLYMLCFPGESAAQIRGEGWIDLVISGPKGQGRLPLRLSSPSN